MLHKARTSFIDDSSFTGWAGLTRNPNLHLPEDMNLNTDPNGAMYLARYYHYCYDTEVCEVTQWVSRLFLFSILTKCNRYTEHSNFHILCKKNK